ncbi:MAG: protein translocase subunit SecF [Acidimicrobiales bacterium]
MNAIRRLFRGENDYDFVRLWRYGLIASVAMVVLSVVLLVVQNLALGLDFEGGTAWEVPTSEVSVAEARELLRPLGEENAKIQTVGADVLRVQSAEIDAAAVAEVRSALAEGAGITSDQIAVTTVGPSWGDEISGKAIRALVLFFIAIALYITFALRDWRMAVGALVAVVHDIIISVGLYALLQIEVTPATVIAFLTILGFSLYDTVVVYSRIRDNTPMVSVAGRMTYTQMASLSLNQVLMRSINTSFTAVLPVLSILVVGSLIFGATTLQEFGFALLVGLVVGVYSSIFVATPIVAYLNERSPAYAQIRQRLDSRTPAGVRSAPGASRKPGTATDASAAADGETGAASIAVNGDLGGREGAGQAVTAAASSVPSRAAGPKLPPGYSASHPPRPRRTKRR